MTDNNVMTDEEIIAEYRKRSLQNGASLGSHSGFMDLVADRLEELIEENKNQKAEIEQLRKSHRLNLLTQLDIAEEIKNKAIKEFVVSILSPYEGKPYLSKGDLENIVNLLAKYY